MKMNTESDMESKPSRWKCLAYNSVTVNLPKNVIQFSLGFVLYWVTFGVFNPLIFIISISSFLLAYSSVYLFNDIMDFEDDKEDLEKSKWKLLVSGRLSIRGAMSLYILLLLLGTGISVFVSKWFTLILLGMVFLNFLHSSNVTRLKKSIPKTSVNMTLIEFLKYSAGWFAFTSDLSKFPFWLMLCFSIAYTVVYIFYKFKFTRELLTSNKIVFVTTTLLFLFSYGISFFIYSFSLPLLFLGLFVAVTVVFLKYFKIVGYKMKKLFVIEYIVLPIIIISFLLLIHPSVAELNQNMTKSVGQYKDAAVDAMPSGLMTEIGKMDKYKQLEDLEAGIRNMSKNLSFLPS
ncbi:MAG: UbiA family prenyltransferase [Candidatus Aenigmarchaeota archaeon]|nr:UbiA family prenyltransferase [Candidatus Aenigmarchaeota archaeon]